MSDSATRLRIRAQGSAGDDSVMGFVLDEPVQDGRSARFEAPGDAPLARALFELGGVCRIEVTGATIWVKKTDAVAWTALKPAIAAAIRTVMAETDAPLGNAPGGAPDPDAELFHEVQDLLNRQVNPAVAAHGGHISVERVEGDTVFLRMSGGCQGCAASAATLRQGVERMLRAALPRIGEIVDLTDHDAGDSPFYTRDEGPSPMLNRPVPADVIAWEDGRITVDPAYLAPRLGLSPEALRAGLQNGDVVGVTEAGEGRDAGKTRIVLRSAHRAWAAEIGPDGSAREVPPPRAAAVSAGAQDDLAARVRAHLEALPMDAAPITYGALARGLELWTPGSVPKVTRALETTMREDAAAGRPFVAARAVSRGRDGLPGPGYFTLARALLRGQREGETEAEAHAAELRWLADATDTLAERRQSGA